MTGGGDLIQLVGLDIGSTTSRVAIADARLCRGLAGRVEVGQIEERLRAAPTRTPFCGEALDEAALLAIVDAALAAGEVRPGACFGGGALLTGLAARAPNAAAVAEALRARVGDAVVAIADDPRLEAWLAFLGNVGERSRGAPHRWVLNLDIGGGTTNLALGRGGEVAATRWLWIGARHVEIEPGDRRIVRCTPEGERALGELGIAACPGDELASSDAERLAGAYAAALEAAAADLAALAALAATAAPLDIAFSGGVGELVCDALAGRPLPPPGAFGDLGIELAAAIARSPALAARAIRPEGAGRATVLGLLRHQTQVPGATLHLPAAGCPTGDLPIVGAIAAGAPAAEIARLVELAAAARPAGAIAVRGPIDGAAARDLGRALGAALRARLAPTPLVALLEANAAKALGGYASEWGQKPVPLAVLDEVSARGAEVVRIGATVAGTLPLSFFRLGG